MKSLYLFLLFLPLFAHTQTQQSLAKHFRIADEGIQNEQVDLPQTMLAQMQNLRDLEENFRNSPNTDPTLAILSNGGQFRLSTFQLPKSEVLVLKNDLLLWSEGDVTIDGNILGQAIRESNRNGQNLSIGSGGTIFIRGTIALSDGGHGQEAENPLMYPVLLTSNLSASTLLRVFGATTAWPGGDGGSLLLHAQRIVYEGTISVGNGGDGYSKGRGGAGGMLTILAEQYTQTTAATKLQAGHGGRGGDALGCGCGEGGAGGHVLLACTPGTNGTTQDGTGEVTGGNGGAGGDGSTPGFSEVNGCSGGSGGNGTSNNGTGRGGNGGNGGNSAPLVSGVTGFSGGNGGPGGIGAGGNGGAGYGGNGGHGGNGGDGASRVIDPGCNCGSAANPGGGGGAGGSGGAGNGGYGLVGGLGQGGQGGNGGNGGNGGSEPAYPSGGYFTGYGANGGSGGAGGDGGVGTGANSFTGSINNPCYYCETANGGAGIGGAGGGGGAGGNGGTGTIANGFGGHGGGGIGGTSGRGGAAYGGNGAGAGSGGAGTGGTGGPGGDAGYSGGPNPVQATQGVGSIGGNGQGGTGGFSCNPTGGPGGIGTGGTGGVVGAGTPYTPGCCFVGNGTGTNGATGTGGYQCDGGRVCINGACVIPAVTYTWDGTTGNWTDAAHWISNTGGVPGPNDNAIINAGTVVLNTNTSLASLTMNDGTLSGTGSISTSGAFNWNKGDFKLAGNSSINGLLSTVNPDPAGPDNLGLKDGGTLSLNGGGDWENSKMLITNGASLVLTAGQTMTIHGSLATSITAPNIAPAGYLNLAGNLIKTGSGFCSIGCPNLSLSGNNIQLNEGQLGLGSVNTTATLNGVNITIASGTTFNINQVGTYNITNSQFNGSGQMVLSTNGATVNLDGNNTISSNIDRVTVGGILNINQPISIARLKTNTTNTPVISICSSNTLTITSDLTNESVGTIKGIGNVLIAPAATFNNSGTIAPGCSPGTLTIEGNITTGTNGILDYEILETGGTVPRDLLQVNGTLTLGGTLNIAHASGTIPAGTYDIATCNGGPNCLTGIFSAINYPPGCNGNCTVVYNGATSSLVATAPIVWQALPLELHSFTANALPKSNEIRWATATERNINYHLLERSPDGLGHWQEINRQAGSLHSTSERQYHYEDAAPLAQSYYRLRSLDVDGSEQVSSIAQVVRTDKKTGILSAYPIPMQDELTVVLAAPAESNLTLQLTDLLGHIVWSQTFVAEAGLNQRTLPLQTLPAGKYYLGLIGEKLTRTVISVIKH